MPSTPAPQRDESSAIGTFDEESCRFFLREVGARVVPYYPFSFGMEEVYSLILEKYGYAGLPDATSVLQDLLEDDECAAGFGDDGDIWRSWRHSWRHRNDDTLNPFVPKVGDFVLQPPTSRCLLQLKATRFLRKRSASSYNGCDTTGLQSMATVSCLPHAWTSITELEHQAISESKTSKNPNSPIGTTFCHQRCRTRVARHDKGPDRPWGVRGEAITDLSDSVYGDADSQQEFVEVTASTFRTDSDPALFVAFEMLDSSQTSVEKAVSSSGGDPEIYTLQQISSLSDGRSSIYPDLSSEDHTVKLDLSNQQKTNAEKASIPQPCSVEPDAGDEDHLSCASGAPQATEHTEELIIKRISSISRQVTKNSRRQSAFFCTSGAPEPKSRRSVHRQARLIDGAIFTSRTRKKNITLEDSVVNAETGSKNGRGSLARLSWTWQNQESRRSWIHSVRSLFRLDSNKNHNIHSEHDRSPVSMSTSPNSMATSHSHKTTASVGSAISQAFQPTYLGLDGACDTPSAWSKSHVNINKTLPEPPDEVLRLLSIQTPTPSLTHSQSTPNRPSTASTTSTRVSQSSSKKEFRSAARELLQSDMANYRDLSPVRESDVILDPSKFEPQGSPKPPSPSSFLSMARRNPFTDDPVPLTPARTPGSKHYSPGGFFAYASRPIPHTQSEPKLQPISPQSMPADSYHIPRNLTETDFNSSPEKLSVPRSEEARGRSPGRYGSPEHVPNPQLGTQLIPRKSGKRSRSPLKRVFGIGTSPSTREITTDVSRPILDCQYAEASKMTSLRQWGNKIRHGFLTVDHDGLQREAQVEQHLQDNASPSQQSTFPISLDPPYQAKVQSDIELMVVVTANRFLLREAKAGRLSIDSVAKVRNAWEFQNRPQVLEFQYDQVTQRDLILSNLSRVRFCGGSADDPSTWSTILKAWGVMAKELAIRTFCSPDSVVRKHMYDAHRLLELLGAPTVTFLAFQDLQVKTLAKITEKQKERLERKGDSGIHSRNAGNPILSSLGHQRNISENSQN